MGIDNHDSGALLTAQEGIVSPGDPLQGRPRPRRHSSSARSASEDGTTLTDVVFVLRQSWPTICRWAAAVVAVVFAITMASRMAFKAHGSLYLGDLQDAKGPVGQTLAEQIDFVGGRNGDVGTEIEILRSRDLITGAILDSGLTSTIVPSGWSAPRYLRWRLGRRNLQTLDGSTRVAAVRASLGEGALITRKFKVRFQTEKAYEVSLDGQSLGVGTLGKEFATSALKVTLLPGPAGAPALGAEYDLEVRPIEEVAEEVDRTLTITVPKATGASLSGDSVRVATLEFLHPSPRVAATFVDNVMRNYLERRQSWKTEEATAADSFLTAEIRSTKESLDDAEKKLADYKKNSSVVVLGDEAQSLIDQAGQYEQQRAAAKLQVDAFSQIAKGVTRGNAPLEQSLVGEAADPVLANLSQTLAQAQQDLRQAEQRFTDEAPTVREARAQVASQMQTVQNYVTSRRGRAQQQLDSLNHLISHFEDRLKTVPRAELELAQLTRNSDVLAKMYTFLMEREQEATVSKASTMSRNHVLDYPVVPRKEDSPRIGMRLAASGIFGLLFGIAMVVLRGKLGSTFQSQRELRRELGHVPLIGVVPTRLPLPGTPPFKNEGEAPLAFDIFGTQPQSAFAEAFRHLRTSIYYSASFEKEEKVVLITSPTPGDGKTLCTLSLATALVGDGKRVLVIEGDLHRPVHHVLYRQSAEPGLSSILSREDVIRSVQTSYGSFDAVTAGAIPRRPAELLSSRQFAALVAYARRTYDFVLIDSPPFPLVSDALVMLQHADRVLTVIRLQNTQRRVAEEHFRRLSESTAHYGIVINDIDGASDEYGYGQGYSPSRPTRIRPGG